MRNLFNLMINAYIEKFNISPLEAFSLLYGQDSYAFLYESLELGGTTGRYSFLGGIPKIIFKAKNGVINLMASDSRKTNYGNPFLCLRDLLKLNKKMTYFAPLTGGAVGYVSYDSIRYIEKIPDKNPDEINMPDLFFIFPQEFIIFDHKYKIARIIMYYRDSTRLKFIKEILRSKPMLKDIIMKPSRKIKYNSNFTPQEFHNIVKRAKDYIFAGDIFQVVLSQRFKTKISSSPFAIYRVLRITNPSPYMYYLKLNDITVLGSSPEILIKLKNRTAISRPLAGTKPRGRDSKEDKKLEKELLKEDKEIAEHIMLVDLARNDLGKVCEYGTVKPTALLKIEKYSKVMHIVSNVTGRLRND
ncbi:MAG: chorismate-binding protein, partial [candidate division WOR-3 bacterium]